MNARPGPDGDRPPARIPTPTPLVIPVATLLGEDAGSTRVVDVDAWIPIEDGPTQTSPAVGSIRLTRTNRGLYGKGTVHTTVAETCARCLRPIDQPIDLDIEEEFLPSIDIHTGRPTGSTAEPDVARLTDAHELDLGRLLADELSLAEPIAPVCRPDCPGLCPVCGEDLSKGDHDHGPGEIDPRLAALAGVRVDEDAENR